MKRVLLFCAALSFAFLFACNKNEPTASDSQAPVVIFNAAVGAATPLNAVENNQALSARVNDTLFVSSIVTDNEELDQVRFQINLSGISVFDSTTTEFDNKKSHVMPRSFLRLTVAGAYSLQYTAADVAGNEAALNARLNVE